MAIKKANEKLYDSKDMPKIVMLDEPDKMARYGGQKMLIAPPLSYDTLMKKIPNGMIITTDLLRKHLANQYKADFTCPLTCGIFVNIAARASYEREGTDETPWWRTLKKDGELNEKYPDGISGQKLMLEMEGHKVIQKGKRYFVENFEEKLFKLD